MSDIIDLCQMTSQLSDFVQPCYYKAMESTHASDNFFVAHKKLKSYHVINVASHTNRENVQLSVKIATIVKKLITLRNAVDKTKWEIKTNLQYIRVDPKHRVKKPHIMLTFSLWTTLSLNRYSRST